MDALLDTEVKFEGDETFVELDALCREPPAPPPAVLRRGTNYSHDAMIDAIISNPTISQGELASMFGYTAGWISQVINSDAFKAKMAQRINDLRDPIVLASMEDQFRGILARGLELTRKKLENEAVSDNFVLRSMELSSRALGYGAKKEEGRRTDVEDKLVDLSANLVNLLRNRKRDAVVLDGEMA